MAQRTVCICDGKYIGIESIYTVINGKQINIPDKVEKLREKSQLNQLKCSCGCGAIVILVAGDRNLREQHFRLKEGKSEKECHLITEGKESIDSKIVLKCWLDDKLHDDNIESRVPICAVDDIDRKYEFTLLSKAKSIAVSYSYDRMNISDEKLEILDSNGKDIKIIYVVDEKNGGTSGQYPENLMKIQVRQGYCLYLSIQDNDYNQAKLEAVFFDQDVDGLWQEITFASGLIKQYDIHENGEIFFEGENITHLLEVERYKFSQTMRKIKSERDKEKKEREERIRKQQEEEKKRQEEIEKRLKELAEKRRIEEEKAAQEEKERQRVYEEAFANGFENMNIPVIDADGKRVVKCKYCGKIAKEKEFVTYGGLGEVNLGRCYACKDKRSSLPNINRETNKNGKMYNPNVCPECGGNLDEKKGKFGVFIGCSNYPKCKYTRNAKK